MINVCESVITHYLTEMGGKKYVKQNSSVVATSPVVLR